MSCSQNQFSWRGAIGTCCLIALVSPLLHLAFASRFEWRALGVSLVAGLVFSNAIGLTATALSLVVWPRVRRRPLWQMAVLGIAGLSLACVAGTFVGAVLMYSLGLFSGPSFWDVFLDTLRTAAFITFTFGAGAGAFEMLRERLQSATLELRTQQLQRERAEKLAAEAQLAALESRVHPHFLFNALNSVSSLIREDPARAERLLERMAALLRFTLDSARVRLVTLEQEMKIVRDYLEIEQTRFGERLRCSVDLPAELRSSAVPPMAVQTLVENAVKYAVGPRRQGGSIRVSARSDGERVVVLVSDDGPGFAPEALVAGHGLDNLRERLATLFGAAACLDFERRPDGMTVTIAIPAVAASAVA